MKILAFLGSPRADGNGAKIVNSICTAASEKGHDVKTIRLYKEQIKPCTACDACKQKLVTYCVHKDFMTRIIPEIIEADCIILSTPVYFGQVSGVTKTFMDRWHTFFDSHFNVRHITGKKLILVTTCAAKPEQFSNVADYLIKWFVGFFGMELVGKIEGGGMIGMHDVLNQAHILEKAYRIGSTMEQRNFVD